MIQRIVIVDSSGDSNVLWTAENSRLLKKIKLSLKMTCKNYTVDSKKKNYPESHFYSPLDSRVHNFRQRWNEKQDFPGSIILPVWLNNWIIQNVYFFSRKSWILTRGSGGDRRRSAFWDITIFPPSISICCVTPSLRIAVFKKILINF